MIDAPAAPTAPARSLGNDVAWVTAGGFALALFAHFVETPFAGDPTVWWADALLSAVLATAPRQRWALLAAAFGAALLVALLLGGSPAEAALARAIAGAAEGTAGGWLACVYLARAQGATTPLTFAGLQVIAVIPSQMVGATIVAASAWALPGSFDPVPGGIFGQWYVTWSGDSFGALGMFPLALALRLEPPGWPTLRQAGTTTLLLAVVAGVTTLSFALLPRPFAFCALVLAMTSLLAGTRVVLLLVWTAMVCASVALYHARLPPDGFSLGWHTLNIFLPVMALAAPTQVLAVAIRRIGHANSVLRRSRERFYQLYDRAPVMLQSLDGRGRTIEVNAQWLATLGYDDPAEVHGQPFERFIAADDEGASDPAWHQRLLGSGTKLYVRLRSRSGRVVHALASAATAPDDARGRRGMVLALEDVSAELAMRAELERERAQLAAITSATSDLAIFLDLELRYASVNRAFERYWNLARADVLGRRPSEVEGQGCFATELAAPLARALAGDSSNLQAAFDFPHGRRVMEVALAPAFDTAGERAGVVVTMHDVTELVNASNELQLLVEQLQHANEGLEQFARIASHDLREPLNTISQFASLIDQDHRAQLPPEAARYFELMGKAAVRMKGLLDDVLQFARLERGPSISLEVVSLDRVIGDLRALLHARLEQTRAALTIVGVLPPVLGQASLLELLFQNLLLNAMLYMPPGLAPRIAISAERMGGLVIVTVADNGIGIPSTELERIFLPFQRLHGYRQVEGSGLGLAICRRIATALGGRIWAESEDGKGTRMRVALQASRPG